jgi:hypothetical protein
MRDLVINVVVFDATEKRFPWLTAWWRLGGAAARAARLADVVIAADGWTSALTQIGDAVRTHADEHRVRIGLLQFWGHGLDGAMLMRHEAFDRRTLQESSSARRLLEFVRDAMHPTRGAVWFRGCNTFRGNEGQRFARESASFFNVPVVGHTFLIWALHGGTHVLAPGAPVEWPADEGIGRRSIWRWSAPFRPATITALHFFPPRTARTPRSP